MRLLAFLAFFLPVSAFAAACVTPNGCVEWVPLKSGPARSLIYRTHPLTEKNDNIRRAFVLIHGATRDEAIARIKKTEHVSDDEKKHAEKDLQKVHDDHIRLVDDAVKAKEAEIMEV